MNSTNNVIENYVLDLKKKFDVEEINVLDTRQLAIDVKKNDVHGMLSYLKSIGWKALSMLTCVDWIEDDEFQLVYLIFNWENGIKIQLRTRLERSHPDFRTITNIYPGAQYYERDVHEFFGVTFEGNPMSNKQLFLELWDDLPPMRKDFDPEAYSKRKFPSREYRSDFSKKAGVEA